MARKMKITENENRAAQAAGGVRVPVPHNPFLKFHRAFPPFRPEPPAPPGGVKAAGSKIT